MIDLTGQPNASFTRTGDNRSGKCCTASGSSTTCVSYKIILDPATDVLSVSLPPNGKKSNSEAYYVDCDGPYDINTPVCLNGRDKNYVIVSYCKPGNDLSTDLLFTTSSGFGVSPDISLRPGCTGTISVTGLIQSTIQWTAIAPTDNIVLYNSYLSATSNASSVTVAPTAAAPGGYIDYQVTGIEQSPCNTIHKSSIVRVWTYPALTVSLTSSSGQTSVCSGSPITLTATASGGNPGYTYQWTNNGVNIAGATSSSISVNTPGTYAVSVNDQLSSCGPVTQSVNITAATLQPPTASGATICSGNLATLTATATGGPFQWYWYDSNHNLVSTNSTYNTLPLYNYTTSSVTYNYTVMNSSGGCSSQPTTVPVTVLPTSAAPTAPPVTVCTGSQATLNATAPGGPYQWYDPAHNPVGNGSSSYTAPLLAAGTYNYSVTSVASGCPGPATTVTVTVLPVPPAPTAAPVTICTGNSALLQASGPPGTTSYQWFDANHNPACPCTGSNITTPILTSSTTYYVLAISGGCQSAETAIPVTVLPAPVAPTAPPVTICAGNTVTLTASAPGGPYQWYDAGGNLVCNNCTTYTPPALTSSTTYSVMTLLGGCPSTLTTVPVTVLPTPPAPTALPATICTGNTATLTATAPGGSYQWYDAGGNLVCNNCTTYTTPVLTTGAAGNTTYTYTVTTMLGGCPSQPTTVPVTVTPLPPTPTVESQ